VPAIMTLLGREAWWMPRWMEPIVPHLQLEGSEATAASEARRQPSAGAGRPGGDRVDSGRGGGSGNSSG
jgi:uncharacterized membrane protein YdfJ with MMPL/SSD domain